MILDIILILLILIVAIIGYKVGFISTLLKLASAVLGIIIAICLTQPVTNLVIESDLDNPMHEKIYTNITTSEAFTAYIEGGKGEEGINHLLQELGIPSFLSGFVAEKVIDSVNPDEIATSIADGVNYIVVFIITFIALLILSSLVLLILKLIFKTITDKVGLLKFIDGVLGIAFYLLVLLLILSIAFTIISLVLSGSSDSSFAIFMNEQLHLEDDKFGLAKYLYENNILKNFIELLF